MIGTGIDSVIGHMRRLAAVAGGVALSDGQLLEAFLARRDEAAFEILVRRHGPMVLGVCRRVLQSGTDADDAFQATFLVLVRKAHTINRPELLASWLYGVAHRTAHKARVMLARRRCRERALGDMDQPEITERTTTCDLRAVLDEEMARLPEKYRVALVLCELEGRSRRHAAQVLGVAEGTLSSRLARGRQLLAALLSRRGVVLSAGAVAAALAHARTDASVSLPLVRSTVRAALAIAAGKAVLAVVSEPIAALTEGVVKAMAPSKLKILLVTLVGLTLLGASVFPRPGAAEPGDEARQAQAKPAQPAKVEPRRPSVILLWMSGGPSQIDTFDLKPGNASGGPFKEIETSVKGIKISEHLPKLARHMDQMVLIRSLTHREGDHIRATHLMHTGYAPVAPIAYPGLCAVLARELGSAKSSVPNFVRVMPGVFGPAPGAGYLDPWCGPLPVLRGPGGLFMPDGLPFLDISDEQLKSWSKVMTEALDMSSEKEEVRAAYGNHDFGECCLLARRLVERRVPVIEITLGGWDTHQNAFPGIKKLSDVLDASWASLMTDLKERKLLETTLIIWAGEFGRTPRINAGQGRDHYPLVSTAVLAGGCVKGGQVIGSTTADGAAIAERPVTVSELHATIYAAVGVNPAKRYQSNLKEVIVPLVDGNAEPVKEALPKKDAPKRDQADARPQGLLQQAERLTRLPAELIKLKRTDGEIVEALFAATLARLPGQSEKTRLMKHLQDAKDREEACRDLLWAVVNSNEFVQLHSLNADPDLAKQFQDVLAKAWKK
jgi:RNA polymerase sigma factor (sigma-70 family)